MRISKKPSESPSGVRHAFAAHASLLFHAVFPTAAIVRGMAQSAFQAASDWARGKSLSPMRGPAPNRQPSPAHTDADPRLPSHFVSAKTHLIKEFSNPDLNWGVPDPRLPSETRPLFEAQADLDRFMKDFTDPVTKIERDGKRREADAEVAARHAKAPQVPSA